MKREPLGRLLVVKAQESQPQRWTSQWLRRFEGEGKPTGSILDSPAESVGSDVISTPSINNLFPLKDEIPKP